jgi:hypothetical protein
MPSRVDGAIRTGRRHRPDPMRNSSAGLERYIYGPHVKLTGNPSDPDARYELQTIQKHTLGSKSIPASFFQQPNAEYISAVLFSNAGTVAKFNRMGFLAGKAANVKALRFGLAYSPDPDAVMPEPFWYVVGDRKERWEEEAIVFHNPNALYPVPEGFFGDSIEVFSSEGDYYHKQSGFHAVTSLTHTVIAENGDVAALDYFCVFKPILGCQKYGKNNLRWKKKSVQFMRYGLPVVSNRSASRKSHIFVKRKRP